MTSKETTDPALNCSENLEDIQVQASGVLAIDDDSETGIFTVVTPVGHFDFLIDQETANQMVQKLREFIRGDSTNIKHRVSLQTWHQNQEASKGGSTESQER